MQNSERKTLDLNELRILDDSGTLSVRVRGADVNDGPAFEMFDSNGFLRVSIGIDNRGDIRMSALAEDGKILIGIGCQSTGRQGIEIYDPQGVPAFLMTIRDDDSRQLDIYGADGTYLWGAP